MKIKLYFTPRTRAVRVRWLLEELGHPYELVPIDLFNGGGDSPAYRRVHPLGHVPAAEIDGKIMIESAAICEWLADQFPDQHLAPPTRSRERMDYARWLHFVTATLEPHAWHHVLHRRLLPVPQREPAVAAWSEKNLHRLLPLIEAAIAQRQSLLDGGFSVVDILLCDVLGWDPRLLKPYPQAFAYMKRLRQREAYRTATADN